jgi:two-component system, sensor histidine kinase and response regulator
MGEGITLADATGRIVYSNPAADRILGVAATDAPPEVWSEHFGVFLPGTDRPFPTEAYPLVRALQGEETDGVEMFIRNPAVPQGAQISVTGRPIRDREGKIVGAAVVFRDVTELRRTEDELRRALSALHDSELRKSELMNFLVHDMKSPLTVVMAGADLLLMEEGWSEEDRRAVMDILSSARTLNRMVLDLLDVQAAEDGKLEPERRSVGVPALLTEAALIARARGAKVTVDADGAPVAAVDAELIRRVLGNLIDNCVRYGPAGGRIWLEAREGEGGEGEKGALLLRVRDEGPGVPVELRETIFEKYARLERDAERGRAGSRGLGLRFCQVAVEAHGGRIWVEDNHPKGAVFCVEIPG